MAEPHDPATDYDGGWSERWESGEGVDDLVLGPIHPYDRSANDRPAARWATRHEVVSRQFADPAEDEESVDAPPDDELPMAPLPASARTSVRGRMTKAERAVIVARRLNVSIEELRRIREEQGRHFRLTRHLRGKERTLAIAKGMRISVSQLDRIRAAEAGPSDTVSIIVTPAGPRFWAPATIEEFAAAYVRVRTGLASVSRGQAAAIAARRLKMPARDYIAWRDRLRLRAVPSSPSPALSSHLVAGPAPASAARVVRPAGVTTKPPADEKERDLCVAATFGVRVAVLREIRRRLAKAERHAHGLAGAEREKELARAAGLRPAELIALRRAEMANLPVRKPHRGPKRGASEVLSTPGSSIRICDSCTGPIGPNGHCRCS